MCPPMPALLTDLGVPEVHGRVTALSHPLVNIVGMARSAESDADVHIALD